MLFRMNRILVVFTACVLVTWSVVGCHATPQFDDTGPPAGRCIVNTDCQDGYRCGPQGFCLDIHHPDLTNFDETLKGR